MTEVLIVGAGSAGSVLAARLSEDPARRVLVLETGGEAAAPGLAGDMPLDPALGRAAYYPALLAPGTETELVRGRGVGGSGAINGAYFVHATDTWWNRWGGKWSAAALAGPRARVDASPIPVRTIDPRDRTPVTAAAVAAIEAAGHTARATALNIDARGHRIGPGHAYLAPARGRENLTVRTGVRAVRLLRERSRIIGIEAMGPAGPERIHADRTVLCAGAVETAALLLRSGIGPGLAHDLPGVGAAFTDHPEVAVDYVPYAQTGARAPVLEATAIVDGRFEIRPYSRPLGPEAGGIAPHTLGVGIMTGPATGTLTLSGGDPGGPPVIAHHYDRDPAGLARATEVAETIAGRLGEIVGTRLSTSQHLSGTCPAGADPARGAVVDDRLAVHRLTGLHIVDTAVFPVVPDRGPHASTVLLAERAAELLGDT